MSEFSNPQAYEVWMGRWSERLAPLFLEFADCKAPGRYLDVGSGTGVMSRCIVNKIEDCEVHGIEPSPSYVDFARRKISDPRVTFEVGDAMDLSVEDDAFDASLALLVLQEVPDAMKVVEEMRRVTRNGRCVAACQWDFKSGMPSLSRFWEAVSKVVPEKEAHKQAKERVPFGYTNVESLANLWTEAHLKDVKTAEIEITMEFGSFDDYWRPFLGGSTPTSSYARTLAKEQREALADQLRTEFQGSGPDQGFALPARALAVRGLV